MSTRYDVVDTGQISASPAQVYSALASLSKPGSDWWSPYIRIEAVNDITPFNVGYKYWIRVLRAGRPKMLVEVVESTPNQYLGTKILGGDYTGTLEWWLYPCDMGTELKCRWRADPNSWLGWLGLAFPSRSIHSYVIRKGFRLLNRKVGAERSATET